MKKVVFFLVIGMLLLSGAAFAQTTQGVSPANAKSTNPDYFAGGGYTGPALGTLTIMDLLDTAPNAFVIVEGYIVQQRVPGTFVLADAAQNAKVSVVVRFNDYGWVNLNVDAKTPVLVYGNVNRSDLRIEIEAARIEIKK